MFLVLWEAFKPKDKAHKRLNLKWHNGIDAGFASENTQLNSLPKVSVT